MDLRASVGSLAPASASSRLRAKILSATARPRPFEWRGNHDGIRRVCSCSSEGSGMLQELVVASGSAVVGAMATESWTVVREGVVRLFRHRGEEELAAVEAQLDGNAALIARSA